MNGNQPAFDPINPTPEQQADMVEGFMAAGKDGPLPDLSSMAFEHGWRMRRNDRAGVTDADQDELARRIRAGEGDGLIRFLP